MARTLVHKNRVLRDGREVEVLKTGFKKTDTGYQRMFAQVREKDTGTVFDVWYTSLVEPHRESIVRYRRDNGQLSWGLRVVPERPDLDPRLAYEVDGLVSVLFMLGVDHGGTNDADPTSLGIGRILTPPRKEGPLVQLYARDGRTTSVRAKMYSVAVADLRMVRELQEYDLMPLGGPGYAKMWREVGRKTESNVDLKEALFKPRLLANPNTMLPKSTWASLGVKIEDRAKRPQ